MDAPLIDKRTRSDVVAQTEALAQRYSGWRPRTDGGADAGRALIAIFGRYAELIIDRLNRVPEKNFLAFLDLIGTELLPPQPARVPLTFRLGENSPVDALVPAGTLAAATAREGEDEEVVFETERDLVVTRAQLAAVYVRDTRRDTYQDRLREARGELATPWPPFEADQPTPHELYIACDEILLQPGAKDVSIALTTQTDTSQLGSWPLEWSRWDGSAWRVLSTSVSTSPNVVSYRMYALPPLEQHAVNDIETGWLRLRLTQSLPAAKSDLTPESVASGVAHPQALALPYAPFGETPSVTQFYLSVDEAFRAAAAMVKIRFQFARRGVAASAGLSVRWTFQQSPDNWSYLGEASRDRASTDPGSGFGDETRGFTRDGEVTFRIPRNWERVVHATRSGRWLKVEILSGGYSTTPVVSALSVSYAWDLPKITSIQLQQLSNPSPQSLERAYLNSSPIDLTKDFYPFGEQPRYNDAFYLACDELFANRTDDIRLRLTLVNPVNAQNVPVPVVTMAGNPAIAWEFWDGATWREVVGKEKPTDTFTKGGEVSLPRPANMSPVTVNGETKHWLRARLVGGHFGEPAKYAVETVTLGGVQVPLYKPVAATYAPPLVKSLQCIPSTSATAKPLSACLSCNDFVFRDHLSAERSPFVPFTVADDDRPALYLGFDRHFDQRLTTLYLQVEPPQPHEVAADKLAELDPARLAQLSWEYASPSGWFPLAVLDETQTLARRGVVQFIAPADMAPRTLFGQHRYWLRVQWQRGDFALPPQLRSVALNTTWASQVTTLREENLGSSNGDAGQTFRCAQSPVLPQHVLELREPLPSAAERAVLRVRSAIQGVAQAAMEAGAQAEDTWVRWQAVADFYGSGPQDRHYVLDALSGVIRFGDGRQGRVPPPGQNNLRITYRTGGGTHGNRDGGSVVQLKSTIPYVASVTNSEAAAGGSDRESLQRARERGPRRLRHRDRAVTAQDLEDLALEADPTVARARALAPTFSPYNLWLDSDTAAANLREHEAIDAGRMGVVVVPNDAVPRPTPSLSLLRRVRTHLLARCSPTADLWVAGPEWVEVKVMATVVPQSAAVADTVHVGVMAALDAFLHPLTGAGQQTGWAFARAPRRSDFYAVIEAVAGVDHVRGLRVQSEPQLLVTNPDDANLQIKLRKWLNASAGQSDAQELDPVLQRWRNRSLVYSGRHEIQLTLESA